MTDARQAMNVSLKHIVVPVLRRLGFKGAFPHFYRESGGHVDLLTFQFRLGGGSFVVELSYAEPDRKNVHYDKDAQVGKLRAAQTTHRLRLDTGGPGSDRWFSFAPNGLSGPQPDVDQIAANVAALIERQALPWWQQKRLPPPSQ
nr:DUF4304 domain-containing protein [uncultured Massilia sp.]